MSSNFNQRVKELLKTQSLSVKSSFVKRSVNMMLQGPKFYIILENMFIFLGRERVYYSCQYWMVQRESLWVEI